MSPPDIRIALGVQYDGSQYAGWQSQPHGNTVQDQLERAIAKFLGNELINPIRVVAAGRTDAGVHGIGQVVHFDTKFDRPDWSWVRGVNTFLPKDIAIQWAKPVSSDFDARFSAQERAYVYYLICASTPIPLLSHRAGYLMIPPGKSLDLQAMRKAASYLLGEHDFSSFRSSECQSKTPVKTLYQLELVEEDSRVYFLIRGNAFLHHMVRNIVGTLLTIGLGRQAPEWMLEVLASKSRQAASPTFSPDGLYLARVGYPSRYQIPEPKFALSPVSAKACTDAFGFGNWLKEE